MHTFLGQRAAKNIQNMGIHGNDGTNSSVIFVKIYGEGVWTQVGKFSRLGINNFRTAPCVSLMQFFFFHHKSTHSQTWFMSSKIH